MIPVIVIKNIDVVDRKPTHIPSASVILLRPSAKSSEQGTEVLLLKKNQKISFGGSWVFPGGKIDEADYKTSPQAAQDQVKSTPMFEAERNAAIRECYEETGLSIDSSKLMPISRWKTPPIRPKRFSTVFFFYDATELNNPVEIDHGEIVDANWFSISDVLAQHNEKKLELSGPAFVTLSLLSNQPSVKSVWRFLESIKFSEFTPKIQINDSGPICLYQGDECYELIDKDATSSCQNTLNSIKLAEQQHRLLMHKDQAWVYINSELGITQ